VDVPLAFTGHQRSTMRPIEVQRLLNAPGDSARGTQGTKRSHGGTSTEGWRVAWAPGLHWLNDEPD
jgi:hypothetical protein